MERTGLTFTGGQEISIGDIADAAGQLTADEFLEFLRRIVQAGKGARLETLLQAITIEQTRSLFEDPVATAIVERVARSHPFTRWLDDMGIPRTAATRANLMAWWDIFIVMASEAGYRGRGQINDTSQSTNLWHATGALAEKMGRNPAAYRYLPNLLVNHPEEVGRKLGEIVDPTAFIEILVGEAMEDMRRSPVFLGAFSTVTEVGADPTVEEALYSTSLALKRG